ncbi:hypothetical protein M9Y10_023496 [Tritrichomonas musculus]|uniref:F5/8 type C domain-containing protein n=1 Tax=Tritrichomonas musculus TaxID=1915356 RepID=A0ABR2KVA5_9EUKA
MENHLSNQFSEKPFPEKFQQVNILKESNLVQISQIMGLSTSQHFIMMTFKNLQNISKETFIENISKLISIKYPSIYPIIAFEYHNEDTNLPTLFFNGVDVQNAKCIEKDNVSSNKTAQFKVISAIAFSIHYLWTQNIELDSINLDNILMIGDYNPVILITNIFSTSRQDVLKSYGEIIKSVCSESFNNSQLNNDKSSNDYSGNLFTNLYSLCNSNFLSVYAMNEIIDHLISFDLNSLVESPQDAERFLTHLFSESLSEKAVLQLYKKASLQELKINELTSMIENLNDEVCELNKLVISLKQDENKINSISKEADQIQEKLNGSLSIIKNIIEPGYRVEIPISNSANGIFAYLINSQKSPFDHLVVPSQSSGDIYCIIDPDSPGNYSSGSGEYEWIQFEFKEPITALSLKIKSAHRAFLKTWGFIAYDEDGKEVILYKTKDDPTLNGKYKETIINFKAIEAKKFRIEKFGENWAGTNFMRIKNFELYSDDPQYIGGIFKTLLERANGDPHKADVLITASNFDFQRFHLLSPARSLCTLYDQEPPWFQVELNHGRAIIHGYRFQILNNFPIDKWQVAGSNDKENWDIIHESEISQSQSTPISIFGVYSQRPYRYFRFINASENLNDDIKLRLRHFDIFGIYLSD